MSRQRNENPELSALELRLGDPPTHEVSPHDVLADIISPEFEEKLRELQLQEQLQEQYESVAEKQHYHDNFEPDYLSTGEVEILEGSFGSVLSAELSLDLQRLIERYRAAKRKTIETYRQTSECQQITQVVAEHVAQVIAQSVGGNEEDKAKRGQVKFFFNDIRLITRLVHELLTENDEFISRMVQMIDSFQKGNVQQLIWDDFLDEMTIRSLIHKFLWRVDNWQLTSDDYRRHRRSLTYLVDRRLSDRFDRPLGMLAGDQVRQLTRKEIESLQDKIGRSNESIITDGVVASNVDIVSEPLLEILANLPTQPNAENTVSLRVSILDINQVLHAYDDMQGLIQAYQADTDPITHDMLAIAKFMHVIQTRVSDSTLLKKAYTPYFETFDSVQPIPLQDWLQKELIAFYKLKDTGQKTRQARKLIDALRKYAYHYSDSQRKTRLVPGNLSSAFTENDPRHVATEKIIQALDEWAILELEEALETVTYSDEELKEARKRLLEIDTSRGISTGERNVDSSERPASNSDSASQSSSSS